MARRKNEARWLESRGMWRLDVQKNNHRRSFYSSLPGRKGKLEAERKADDWLADWAMDDMKFQELWDRYLVSIDTSESSAYYVKQEQIGRMWLLPVLGAYWTSDITIQKMQDCVSAPYKKKGLSKKTCFNVRGALSAAYTFARKNRVSMERPDGLLPPKGASVKERVILQPDDLRKLFSTDMITNRNKEKVAFYIHAWRFMVLTGFRRGETAGMKKQDVRDEKLYPVRSINALGEETKGKTKNAKRGFAIYDRLQGVLDDQAAMLKKMGIISPWLFPAPDGSRSDPRSISRQWVIYREQHGMKTSIHELRHTMVSIVKGDVPDSLLQPIIGHAKSMDTQGVYGHEVEGEDQRVAGLIATAFNRVLDAEK